MLTNIKYLFKKYSPDVKFIFNINSKETYINNLTIIGPLGSVQKKLNNNLF